MIKKILSIGIITIGLNQFVLADNSFKDMEYLVHKEMIKDTTLKLDILKKKYIFNSEEYNALHRAQQVLLDKLPVDSFSTFSRIKLHNIVDNTIAQKEREGEKSKILTADGDLNSALIHKEKMIKEQIEREQKRKDDELSNEDIQNMIKAKKQPSPYSSTSNKKRKE